MAASTDEDPLDSPANTRPKDAAEENIYTKETPSINQNQQIENMEVHQHTHHEGKKNWRSYFWEFLMLFLAVFCGFLAENQREHYVENKREKVYMRSLVEDLDTDIKQLSTYINWKKELIKELDSLIIICSNHIPENNAYSIYKLSDRTILRFGLPEISERTIQQLKNSGGLRLIRKEDVSAEINVHYLNVNRMKSIYEIEKLIRVDLLRTRGELLNASILFKIDDPTLSTTSFSLISKDPLIMNRFINDLLSAEQTSSGLLTQLNYVKASSLNLKKLIQKEYDFE
jgi:hypothetical protein